MALERVADGVWLLRGDLRGAMNIYFIEDGDGVVQFDAGTKSMRKKAAASARELGGLKRIVLGHADADHRGTAPYLGAPVFCHPDEVTEAERDKAVTPYFNLSLLPVAPVLGAVKVIKQSFIDLGQLTEAPDDKLLFTEAFLPKR